MPRATIIRMSVLISILLHASICAAQETPDKCTFTVQWSDPVLQVDTKEKGKDNPTFTDAEHPFTWGQPGVINFQAPWTVMELLRDKGSHTLQFKLTKPGIKFLQDCRDPKNKALVRIQLKVGEYALGGVLKDNSLKLCAKEEKRAIHFSTEDKKVSLVEFPDTESELEEVGKKQLEGVSKEQKETWLLLVHGDSGLLRVTINREQRCPDDPEPDAPQPDICEVQPPEDTWCTTKGLSGMERLCIDMTCNQKRVIRAPDRNVMRPNRGLLVVVRHAVGGSVTVDWGGTRGLLKQTAGQPPAGPPGRNGPGALSQTDITTTSLSFPPRLPGGADVKIEVELEGEQPSKQEIEIELEVDSLSWGAARFGVGTIFGPAAGTSYGTRTQPGSMQPEIVATDRSPMSFELVLGFAMYPEALCNPSGRSHTGGRNWHVAPYVGFGLIGNNTSGISALKSFYGGLEVEFASNFSLALTGVARKVTGLSTGFEEGSPVEANSSFTTDRIELGFALVLNATPEFLQFKVPASEEAGQ